MKTIKLMLIMIVMTTAAWAQTRPGFEVGAQLLNHRFRQSAEGELVEKDEARFSGITAGYTKTFGNGAFVRGRLHIASGSADLKSGDGVTQLSDVDQGVGFLEVHGGRDFRLSDGATISPFAGIGVRVLLDDSGGKESGDAIGFDRRIGFRYVPLGADATFTLRSNATLTLSAQYNWMIDGQAEADLSDGDPQLPNVNLAIDGGSGYELGAMLGFPIARHKLSVGPFLRKWSVDRSKSATLLGGFQYFEPRSRSTEAGVRFSFAF